MDRFRKVPSES